MSILLRLECRVLRELIKVMGQRAHRLETASCERAVMAADLEPETLSCCRAWGRSCRQKDAGGGRHEESSLQHCRPLRLPFVHGQCHWFSEGIPCRGGAF